jgi:hypothetical protein
LAGKLESWECVDSSADAAFYVSGVPAAVGRTPEARIPDGRVTSILFDEALDIGTVRGEPSPMSPIISFSTAGFLSSPPSTPRTDRHVGETQRWR